MKKNNSFLLLILGLVTILALGATGYFAKQYSDLKKNPNKAAEAETTSLLKKVSAIYDLPKATVTKDGKETTEAEQPTVATVQDKDKLKDQPFFASAVNGDKLLIFPQSKKAIIYRESENRIINSGPIAITQGAQTATPVKVKVVNGASSVTSAKTTSDKLLADKNLPITIVSNGDAKKRSYTKSQVVAVDEAGAGDVAANIAKDLGVQVTTLPEGEDKPGDAQILVISVE
jgi:hypothetical protein